MTDEIPEWAEEYTFRERVWIFVRGVVIGGAVIVAWKLWLLPEFKVFTASAPCLTIFGVSGVVYVWYGLFVGLPVFMFLVFALIEGRRGLKILRDGQSPPIGVKVLAPTRIKRGVAARRRAYLCLLIPALFMVLAVWEYFQVRSLVHALPPKHGACTANYSLKRTAEGVLRYYHALAAAAA